MEKNKPAGFLATPAHILTARSLFGAKTYNLALLLQGGFQVPAFVAISSDDVFTDTFMESPTLDEVAESACAQLSSLRYAVRSSAFAEDSTLESHAGEFLSVIDISKDGVADAIRAVVLDAKAKGYVTKDRPFSLIIQEYIKGDIAGVVFTRNPLGGREAVCEWRSGEAAGVVGGAPVSRIYRNADAHIAKEYFSQQEKLFTTARAVEDFFGVAQDIEWVVSGGTLFVLQARPITTIKKEELEAYRSIDVFTKDKDVYFYSRSGVGESFSTCTPLSLDVLRMVYANGGPIAHAYRMLGVDVHLTDNFVSLHGSLYVDGAKEIEQFFPAYAYSISANGLVPKVVRWRGILKTLKNARRLSKITSPHPRLMRERFTRHVLDIEEVARASHEDAEKILSLFLRVYQDIFLTNLYAEAVFRDAEKSLHHAPFSLAALLSISLAREKEQSSLIAHDMLMRMKGNSLNISDQSVFSFSQNCGEVEPRVASWWGNLSGSERRRYEKIIRHAQEYQHAREEGRLLTVLLVSLLREALCRESALTEELMHYATIRELLEKSVSSAELSHRKAVWNKDAFSDMPSVIATVPPLFAQGAMGVSHGTAEGIVVTNVGGVTNESILFVTRLTPDLAPSLSQIKGIIAVEGGMLSHLAICAREAGVPVVIDPHAQKKLKVGMRVRIDGTTGIIEIL